MRKVNEVPPLVVLTLAILFLSFRVLFAEPRKRVVTFNDRVNEELLSVDLIVSVLPNVSAKADNP